MSRSKRVLRPEQIVYERIERHGGMSERDLAKELGLREGVVNRLCQRLRRQGRIEKAGRLWVTPVPF